MRRTALTRRTPLRAVSTRTRHLRLVVDDSGKEAWDAPVSGICACGCGRYHRRLARHHVLLAQIVRREGGRVYDLTNSMLVHPDCHMAHHQGNHKIHMDRVPDTAIEFSLSLMGLARTNDYFDRRYAS